MIKPYAGWAALALLAVGLLSGVSANNFVIPLLFLLAAAALAVFRFWQSLKTFDFWALDEWARMRYIALDVRDWQAPHNAAGLYGSQVAVRTRNDAAAEMNTIMMELIRGQERPSTGETIFRAPSPTDARVFESNRADRNAMYDAAQMRFNQCNAALSRELLEQLTRGDLLAKGLPTRDDIALAERIIPISRWRVMTLDIAKGQASGSGWHYTGIVIGRKKPQVRKAPQPHASRSRQPQLGEKSTKGRESQRPD